MNENFIKEIEIKNFKCFEYFKANGFKRVNLIGGKNNVGKTAFMEACWINELNKKNDTLVHSFVNMVNAMTLIEQFRHALNYDNHDLHVAFSILKKFNNMSIQSNNNSVKLNIEVKDLDVIVKINDSELGTSLTSPNLFENILSDKKIPYENFIPSCKIDNDLMIILYDRIKENRKRNQLNQYISEFDSEILEFEIINNLPKVFLDSRKQFENLAELGHGLKRYISIISAILVHQDSCLFLDEIENGIHYTRLDRLWEIILILSEELNCQIFATTHSKECIEAYYRVSKKLDDEDICFIELGKVKGEIKALVLDKEMFLFELEQSHEVRGW